MTIWTCGVCEVNFDRPGRRTYRFCSPACRGVALRTPPEEKRIQVCEVCQTAFTRRGTKAYRFCSVPCRSVGQRPERPSEDELRNMYVDQGLTANDIGRIYARDPKTTWSWLRAAGIETRPRGSNVDQQFKPGDRSAFAGHRHSDENRAKFRALRLADGRVPYLVDGVHHLKGVTGPAHPNWKGGLTPERQAFYSSREWKDVAQAVWVRDNYRCQRCDVRPPSKGPKHNRGHVHHIVTFQVRELRAVLSNLILLCAPCHRWVHSRANADLEYVG